MRHRKCEPTGVMNERDFPHIVELMVPLGDFHDEGSGLEDFHRERGIPLRPGQGRQEAAQSYVRFCFPNVAGDLHSAQPTAAAKTEIEAHVRAPDRRQRGDDAGRA